MGIEQNSVQSELPEQEVKKRPRVDGQITGLAGELFVAAELLKRGLQTSVTFGNAKAIDLLAFNPETDRTFSVQVKAIRKPNVFPIAHSRVSAKHVYVFVVLNKPGERVRYYIVPVKSPRRFESLGGRVSH